MLFRRSEIFGKSLLRLAAPRQTRPAIFHVATVHRSLALKTPAMAALDFYYAPICPFAHRAWLAIELLGLPYGGNVIDLQNKSAEFVELYPKATGASKAPGAPAKVPVIRDGDFLLAESAVITEYLINKYGASVNGFNATPDAKGRALTQLMVEQVGSAIIKGFYMLLSAQTPEDQSKAANDLLTAIAGETKDSLIVAASAALWGIERCRFCCDELSQGQGERALCALQQPAAITAHPFFMSPLTLCLRVCSLLHRLGGGVSRPLLPWGAALSGGLPGVPVGGAHGRPEGVARLQRARWAPVQGVPQASCLSCSKHDTQNSCCLLKSLRY